MTDKVPTFYLMFYAQGVATGVSGFTPDGTMPQGAVICTADQAREPYAWCLQGGQVVAAAVSQVDLVVYLNERQWTQVLGGYQATLNGAQYRFGCDASAAAFMASKMARLQLPDPPVTINWQVMDGSFVTIQAADFTPLALKLEAFVQSTFDTCMAGLAGITAGTLTTTDQLDGLPWPVDHD